MDLRIHEWQKAIVPNPTPKSIPAVSSHVSVEAKASGGEEPYTIKCICDFTDDDGNTIYCEHCDTWQHIECYYPDKKDDATHEDFTHSCVDCNPQPLNRQRAKEHQILRRTNETHPGEVVGIAKAFSECSDLWKTTIKILTQQQAVPKGIIRKLESAHNYICLWADGFHILNGKFEKRLKKSQRAGDLTIKLLQNICRTLTQELTPIITGILTLPAQEVTSLSLTAADLALTSERLAVFLQGDNDSDTASEGEVIASLASASLEKVLEEVLDDIADDLRSDTQCLLDLGARFEEQVTNPIVSEAAANPSGSSKSGLYNTFIEKVTRLYPHCDTTLASRLGKACWLRFLRFARWEHQEGDDKVTQNIDSDFNLELIESESVEFRSVAGILSPGAQSRFHDSGLGTYSYASPSHQDTKVSSSETSSHPLLPEGGFQGKSFLCKVCGRIVSIGKECEWRLHLLGDIKLYVCPESECDAPLFPNFERLHRHMREGHPTSAIWIDSECRICRKAVSNREMVVQHMAHHMETIAVAIAPQPSRIVVDKAPVTDPPPKKSVLLNYISKTGEVIELNRVRTKKTGCNKCKQRRIRCDEKRPSCTQCVRSHRICTGYPPPPRNPLPPILPRPSNPLPSMPSLTHPSLSYLFPRHRGSPVDNGDERSQHELNITSISASQGKALELEDDTRDYPKSTSLVTPTDKSSQSTPGPLPPIAFKDSEDATETKRARNTLAARKSRERRYQQLEDLNDKIAKLEQERDKWKSAALEHGAGLP